MPVELIPQALCKVEDVKELMTAGASSVSSTPNDLITHFINAFSIAMEGPAFLNRGLLLTDRTEYFDGGKTKIWLSAPPVSVEADGFTPKIQIWDDGEHLWGDDSLLTVWDDYGVRVATGCVWMDGGTFGDGSRNVKVFYTGGLVTPNDPTSVPYDLRLACAMQVLNWYQRKSELGLDSLAVPSGGAIQMSEPSKMLRFVMQVVQNNRRFGGTL